MLTWLLVVAAADPAYLALREGRLDDAVALFRLAVQQEPAKAHLRKDLGYTLLRIGERERARDEFAAALKMDPGDERTALEYAYLCYETRRPVEARRTFQRLSESRNTEIRESARAAFENVDRPLREGIARWKEALERAPGQWSAHEELARLAEERDSLTLAAEHYEQAWRLRAGKTELLLDLARVWEGMGEREGARKALVAAWRRGSTRVSETARERMNGSIPGESELALSAPERAPDNAEEPLVDPKGMGLRSLRQSYLADAQRYLTLAHQQDPGDAEVTYSLGLVANLLGNDREALNWFSLARRAPDRAIAEKASVAYSRLRPTVARFGATAWAVPFYSSRWNDLFLYGQVRGEARMMKGRLVPYLSLRFVGNAGGRHQERWSVSPQYLSETSVIGGAGLRWQIQYNLSAWAEAGESMSYTGRRAGTGLARPDYRAGASWLKGKGALLGSPEPGWFIETGLDPIYASRFDHDLFLYSQTRVGYTLRPGAGGWQVQLISHWNLTVDRLRYYWANLAEAGAGVRMKLPGAPRGTSFRAEILRGAHLVNSANPMGPNYWDFRSGVWYAFAH